MLKGGSFCQVCREDMCRVSFSLLVLGLALVGH